MAATPDGEIMRGNIFEIFKITEDKMQIPLVHELCSCIDGNKERSGEVFFFFLFPFFFWKELKTLDPDIYI